MLLSSDTESAIATSMGLGMIGFAKAYERLTPDILVVLGDRFEILAAVSAGAFQDTCCTYSWRRINRRVQLMSFSGMPLQR